MKIHQDWRGKIHDTLRARRTKLGGDYIQRNLDYLDLLLPRLRVGAEIVMQRRDISALTDEEWSEASIGKFLKHLTKAGVLDIRQAGSRGLGITLRHDLTKSPWKSRQPNAEPTQPPPPIRVRKTTAAPQSGSERTTMPATPAAGPQEDYETKLDLDLTLGALDVVSQGLMGIHLDFASNFAGETAAKIYEAQEEITKAVMRLGQIRAAISAGDDSDLELIVTPNA